jgi:hypothetical protein
MLAKMRTDNLPNVMVQPIPLYGLSVFKKMLSGLTYRDIDSGYCCVMTRPTAQNIGGCRGPSRSDKIPTNGLASVRE